MLCVFRLSLPSFWTVMEKQLVFRSQKPPAVLPPVCLHAVYVVLWGIDAAVCIFWNRLVTSCTCLLLFFLSSLFLPPIWWNKSGSAKWVRGTRSAVWAVCPCHRFRDFHSASAAGLDTFQMLIVLDGYWTFCYSASSSASIKEKQRLDVQSRAACSLL